jgi:hypothetical protein
LAILPLFGLLPPLTNGLVRCAALISLGLRLFGLALVALALTCGLLVAVSIGLGLRLLGLALFRLALARRSLAIAVGLGLRLFGFRFALLRLISISGLLLASIPVNLGLCLLGLALLTLALFVALALRLAFAARSSAR